jgi:hypothetical protein
LTLQPEELAEGERRLVYFYVYGQSAVGAVVCPGCAADAPEPEKLRAVYTASRLYRCGHCLVWIGPANPTEEEEA